MFRPLSDAAGSSCWLLAAISMLSCNAVAQLLPDATPPDEQQYLALIEQETEAGGLTAPTLVEPLAARTSDLHIQRGRVLDTGEIPEQPLIGEGREYILALQPDDAATYSLWSAGVGLWSGVDTLFVRKVLAQPAAR